MFPLVLGFVILFAVAGGVYAVLKRRNLDRWLGTYIAQTPRRGLPPAAEDVHVLICVADHYEPKYGRPAMDISRERVRSWTEGYPAQFGRFRDSDGRKPRHTFFYPAEEYDAELLDAVAELCAAGHGEVEIHLHHDNDTPENFRRSLVEFRDILVHRHGLLGRHRLTGEPGYVFIHGNWALCNSRPDGRYCGVNNEIPILRDTGCFADMTLPSAPSDAQTPKINCIYYATDKPGRPCSHADGVEAGTGPRPEDGLMIVQGPLMFDWTRRKFGLVPRLENGCLQNSQPPSLRRLLLWMRAGVRVAKRPDWLFVKLHCHGIEEDSRDALLGEPMVRFHEELAEHARANPRFHYHYVTAREMVNLARAAEAGWTGSVADALDHEYLPPPLLNVSPGERRRNAIV